MTAKRFLTLPWLITGLLLTTPAAATAIASSSLDFSNLTMSPIAGSLTLDTPWLVQGFASADNSLGESAPGFNSGLSPAALSTGVAVTWATAGGTAGALGDPPDLAIRGSAISSVDIPGCDAAAAFTTAQGALANSFTISGTGVVDVSFGIDVARILNVSTDACGFFGSTDTIFSLQVDGDSVLSFDPAAASLSIGPNDARTGNALARLTNTVSLARGVSHFLILEADSESQAQTAAPIPEPMAMALLLAALGALLPGFRPSSPASRGLVRSRSG